LREALSSTGGSVLELRLCTDDIRPDKSQTDLESAKEVKTNRKRSFSYIHKKTIQKEEKLSRL